MTHALLSPSGAAGWLRCAAKVWREKDLPDTSGEFAAEGTAAHFLRDTVLQSGEDCAVHIGKRIFVTGAGDTCFHEAGAFEVTLEMAGYVQQSVDVIRSLAEGGELFPEARLDISFITGEVGAKGTADAVILRGDTLIIDDLKYGRGVPVYAEENEQLMIYAAAALAEYDLTGEVENVVIRISQPRINNDSEWAITVPNLNQRITWISEVAAGVLANPDSPATPGEKQCQFCKAKATCPELQESISRTIGADFADLDELEARTKSIESLDGQTLGDLRKALSLIEQWVKAVYAESERRLLAGEAVDGFKVVQGRAGNRSWVDAAAAEAALKAMRMKVDEIYDFKLASPTSLEKVMKEQYPRKWAKLQQHITKPAGRPTVVEASDKRPALQLGAQPDDFDDLT